MPASVSRVMVDPTELTNPRTMAPFSRPSRRAASVSMVSPLCEIEMIAVPSSMIGLR